MSFERYVQWATGRLLMSHICAGRVSIHHSSLNHNLLYLCFCLIKQIKHCWTVTVRAVGESIFDMDRARLDVSKWFKPSFSPLIQESSSVLTKKKPGLKNSTDIWTNRHPTNIMPPASLMHWGMKISLLFVVWSLSILQGIYLKKR